MGKSYEIFDLFFHNVSGNLTMETTVEGGMIHDVVVADGCDLSIDVINSNPTNLIRGKCKGV